MNVDGSRQKKWRCKQKGTGISLSKKDKVEDRNKYQCRAAEGEYLVNPEVGDQYETGTNRSDNSAKSGNRI